MEKDRWARAAEIESNPKTPLDPSEIHGDNYELPIISLDIGETDVDISEGTEVEERVKTFLQQNPELESKIESEKLDIVAHQIENRGGKKKWILIIGFGFAALGLGFAGYKTIRKYRSRK